MWWLIILLPLCVSAQERVIIENKGDHYHVEVYQEEYPRPKKSHKKYKRPQKKYVRKRERYYVSKENGTVFHRPSCRFAKKIKHKVIFKTRKKALSAGLRPCRICKP